MITLASVDLPEPLGPISAWISFEWTSRSRPLRICFSPAETWRLRMLRSAIDGHQGKVVRSAGGELDELGERGAFHGLDHAALDAGPQQLGRAAVTGIVVVGAQDALAFDRVVDEAGHGCDD